MKLELAVMSGAGNLFVVASTAALPPANAARYSPQLCQAARSLVGRDAEGVLLVEPRGGESLHVHFFNPDGTSGMMCGNGARCAAAFAARHGWFHTAAALALAGEHYRVSIADDGTIAVEFPPPRRIVEHARLELDGTSLDYVYVDVGSDHVVIEEHVLSTYSEASTQAVDFAQLAPRVRAHSAFPQGANVNLYRAEHGVLHLVTYERGVERITGACGTGALATAVIAWLRNQCTSETITVIPPSGERLTVTIYSEQRRINKLTLSGPAQLLGTVAVELPPSA
ncbi:Diaminopimelate epimerase [bacterium HR20]|nr:Diaminopimelate epimerase [bacterium HR20]